MDLLDRLHCPRCKGRLQAASDDALVCSLCDWTVPVVDGIGDFAAGAPPAAGTDRYRGDSRRHDDGAADLLGRIQAAAGDRWPASLGEMIEFGCGRGETTHSIVAAQQFRSLLVLDSDIAMLQACRSHIDGLGGRPIGYATLNGAQDALRDAVADTIMGTGLLSGIGDVRGFLTTVFRVLRPGGRAAFVVPNRRYYQAMCLAMAEALVQRHARDGAWPDGQQIALELLAQTRRLLIHRGDAGFLSNLEVKHLFDTEALQDLGAEIGFATATAIPLDPDPAGAETMRRICQGAGAPDSFIDTFGTLAAAVGQSYFSLLNRMDASASTLLWLTKPAGPTLRIFHHQPPPPAGRPRADAALGGVAPRWSVELLARDTIDGIVVSVGGWCLCNTDVHWVRLTLGDTARHAPVWRPRPDVHDVLNRHGLYHPLNTLCSGIANDLLFEGIHPDGNTLPFRLDILLTNGVIVSGPAPESLLMDGPMVIAH
ncbi:methyltransferase [Rhodopila sp.]|uniref:methyltransferase n=1 Tax=Rhodopila sp. TaxID=2480087 RepID=UPI003D0ABAF2